MATPANAAADVGGACARCKGPRYCSRVCQRQDWKRVHKAVCKRVAGGDATVCREEAIVFLQQYYQAYCQCIYAGRPLDSHAMIYRHIQWDLRVSSISSIVRIRGQRIIPSAQELQIYTVSKY